MIVDMCQRSQTRHQDYCNLGSNQELNPGTQVRAIYGKVGVEF